jgi:hypothetical protein
MNLGAKNYIQNDWEFLVLPAFLDIKIFSQIQNARNIQVTFKQEPILILHTLNVLLFPPVTTSMFIFGAN